MEEKNIAQKQDTSAAKEVLKHRTGINVAAFVCGIISVLSAPVYYITITTGVLAIVFGAKGARASGSKLAKTGLILGIIGLSFFLLFYGIAVSGIILSY